MSRKWILAAIGGGEAAGPEVEAFGKLVAHGGAILMTGGIPKPNSFQVTQRAQAGCEAAGGLMISVLPNQERNEIVPCSKKRRFEVRTNVTKYGRDPITGAAADMIFVFPGDVGTLVELAYASKEKRPIVFCGTEAQWKEMDDVRQRKRSDIREGIETAIREYGPGYNCVDLTTAQVTQAVDHLEQKLKEALQKNNLGTIGGFLQVCSGPVPADTYFRGLPNCSGVKEFRRWVDELSAFGPTECFP
ncbi:hypothetical protein [Mesorhizobium sp. M0698]|uniref:SLOG cluster 4 domain-containing protein n=1 Tax=Mesorhizobium sp. M0698 TaxID=2956987 RepID=UPI00333A8968